MRATGCAWPPDATRAERYDRLVIRPSDVDTAADVDALIGRLYGDVSLAAEGVLHVTAVWRAPDGALVTLKINERTPKSEYDFFALNLARARADAIVVTGKVLRDEPGVRFALQGAAAGGLRRWRCEVHGRGETPWLVVLTSGRDLDLDHPAFDGQRTVVVTSETAASALVAPPNVELVGLPSPSIRAAIQYARDALHAKIVSIEAGPTTTRPLYRDPCRVDELMLSVYEEASIPNEAHGPELVPFPELERLLGPASSACRIEEPSGTWSFQILGARNAERGRT